MNQRNNLHFVKPDSHEVIAFLAISKCILYRVCQIVYEYRIKTSLHKKSFLLPLKKAATSNSVSFTSIA